MRKTTKPTKPSSAAQFQEELEKTFRNWAWSVQYYTIAATLVLDAKQSEELKSARDNCTFYHSAFRVFMSEHGWTTEELVAIEEAAWVRGSEAANRDFGTSQMRDMVQFLTDQMSVIDGKMDTLRERQRQLRERRAALVIAQREAEAAAEFNRQRLQSEQGLVADPVLLIN